MSSKEQRNKSRRIQSETMNENEKRIHLSTNLAVNHLYQHGKTTVPKEVRERLKLKDGDKLIWSINDLGNVVVLKGTIER